MGIHHGYRPSGNAGSIFLNYLYTNNIPKTVYDFASDIYISGYRGQSFNDSVTHSATSLRTMYDSTGKVVWAPHNLVDDSQTLGSLSLLEVTKSASSIKTIEGVPLYRITDTTANADHRVLDSAGSQPVGSKHTFQFFFEAENHVYVYIRRFSGGDYSADWFATINLQTATVVSTTGCAASIVQVGSTSMYRVLVTPDNPFVDTNGTLPFYLSLLDPTGTSAVYTGTETSFLLGGLSIHRSDLGGMVDNPDQPAGLEKYVPTTSSAVYLPRRNAYYHDGESWTNGGLYQESAAATNLLTNSNVFSSWTATNSVVSQDANSPASDTTAWTLNDNTGGSTGEVNLYRSVTVSTFTTYTFSVFAKADQLSILALGVSDFSFPNDGEVYYDLTNGIVLSSQGTLTGRIERAGNDYYRCSLTFTTDTSDTQGILKINVIENAASDVGVTPLDGTSSILIWGAQFEAGQVASSYIPTGTAAVTRTAETLILPAAKLPYSTSSNTIRIQGALTYNDFDETAQYTIFRQRTDANNYISLSLNTDSSTTGYLEAAQSTDNEMYSVATYDSYVADTSREYNVAVVYDSDRMSIASDGVLAQITEAPTELPSLASVNIELGYDYTGFIKNFIQWDTDISDAGISTVSSVDLTPTLLGDFVNDYYRNSAGTASFGDVFTHSSTSLSTMVDSDGILKWAPHNIVTYSQQLDNAAWTKVRASISANAANDPAGNATLDKVVEDTASGTHLARLPAVTVQTGATYTLGFVASAAGRDTGQILIRTSSTVTCDFDLTNVLVSSGDGSITALGGGLYYVTFSFTADGAWSIGQINLTQTYGGSTSYTGDGSSGMNIGWVHLYRSDLPMADNPDQTVSGLEKYVPTTSVAVYLSRRNHHTLVGDNLVNSGLLLENEARTNLITYSTVANQPLVVSYNVDYSLDAATSPSGAQDADLIKPNSTFINNHVTTWRMTTPGFGTVDGPVTYSVYVKPAGYNYIALYLAERRAYSWVKFDLSKGTVDYTAERYTIYDNETYGIEPLANGWFRCYVGTRLMLTEDNQMGAQLAIYDRAGGTRSTQVAYNGDGTSGIYVWGKQVEIGNNGPSSFIYTDSTSTSTRAAETLAISSSLVPANLTVHIKGKLQYSDEGAESQQTFWRRYKDADEFIIVDLDTDSTDTGEVNAVQSNGAASATVSIDAYETDPSGQTSFNIISSHGVNRINVAADGLLATADATSSTLPSFTSENLDVGHDFMGTLEKFAVWNSALVDGKISNITEGSKPVILGTPDVE